MTASLRSVDISHLGALLGSVDTIVVVGCSADPTKEANSVPARMQQAGFRIVPVNPRGGEILGEPVYRSLAEAPQPIEMVNVFRPSDQAADVVRQAVGAGARAVWLQEGIVSAEGRAIAEAAGVTYVEDACVAVVRAANRIVKTSPGAKVAAEVDLPLRRPGH